jgi:FlgN protein
MSKMSEIFGCLSELGDALRDMKILLFKERDDIVNLNLMGLAERRETIDQLFGRIGKLNGQTSLRIATACQASGSTKETCLSALIEVMPTTDRNRFVLLQQTIQRVSSEIDNAIIVNRGILEDSLAFADQTLTSFAGMLKSSNTYGQAGRYVESVDRSRIINREI